MKTKSQFLRLAALPILFALGIPPTSSAAQPHQQSKPRNDYLPIPWKSGYPAAISTGDLNYRLGVGVVFWVMQRISEKDQTVMSQKWAPCSGHVVSNDLQNIFDLTQARPFESIRELIETGLTVTGSESFSLEASSLDPSLLSNLCKTARREPDNLELQLAADLGRDSPRSFIYLISGRSSLQDNRLAIWSRTQTYLEEPSRDSNGLAIYKDGKVVPSGALKLQSGSKTRHLYDCVQRTTVLTDVAELDPAGNIVRRANDFPESSPNRVVPGTTGDIFLSAVCTIYGFTPP